MIQYFLLLFWPCLAPLREELFLAVHRCTERKPPRGYAENAETLRTTDYPDVTDTCWGGADADALQYGHAIHRALQIRVISAIRGWLYFRASEVIRLRRSAFE